MSASPLFEVISGLSGVWRRGLGPDKIADALKVDSGARSFPNNTMVVNGFTAREGEWLAPGADSKWNYAGSTDRIARPIWMDPSERWDSEGGMTVLESGSMKVKTNMIDLDGLSVNDELVVGTLPVDHPVVPEGNALVRLATKSSGSLHTVVAIVEEIGSDYAIIQVGICFPKVGAA